MSSPHVMLQGKGCAPGDFEGEVVVSQQPFGFWQGIDPQTGMVIDKRHDLCGTSLKGKVFFFPYGRGSTGTPGIFLEAVRNGCAPAAIVNVKSEPMIVMCALLAEAFFNVRIPIVDGLDTNSRTVLRTGDRVRVNGTTGAIEVISRGQCALEPNGRPPTIIDRLVHPKYNAALRLLDEGLVLQKDIDVTCRLGLGYPEGSIERVVRGGLAEHYVISTALFATYGTPGYAPALRSVVAAERAEIRR